MGKEEKGYPLWGTDVMFGSPQRMERMLERMRRKEEKRERKAKCKLAFEDCRLCWRAYFKRYKPDCEIVLRNMGDWSTPMPCDRPLIDVMTGEKIGWRKRRAGKLI